MTVAEMISQDYVMPFGALVYVLRHGKQVIYVGKSNNPPYRLLQHLGRADFYIQPDDTGDYIESVGLENVDVELLCVPEEMLHVYNKWMRDIEIRLIRLYRPLLNVLSNGDSYPEMI